MFTSEDLEFLSQLRISADGDRSLSRTQARIAALQERCVRYEEVIEAALRSEARYKSQAERWKFAFWSAVSCGAAWLILSAAARRGGW